MLPAASGKGFTVRLKLAVVAPVPQLLVPTTVTGPDCAVPEKLTVIEVVLLPLLIVAPEGNVQV